MRFCIFILALCLLFFKDVEAQTRPKARAAETTASKAFGVVVIYHQWPSFQEQNKVEQEYLKKYNLKVQYRLRYLKTLTFLFFKDQDVSHAKKLCKIFEKDKNIKSCHPDVPARYRREPSSPDAPDASAGPLSSKLVCTKHDYYGPANDASKTEAAGEPCIDCAAKGNASAVGQIADLVQNLSCPLVQEPCRLNFSPDDWPYEVTDSSRLSTFWAQELVGMDLVRQELSDYLEREPNQRQPNLVAVFEGYDDSDHATSVVSLVSHPTAPTGAFNFGFEVAPLYKDNTGRVLNTQVARLRGLASNSTQSPEEQERQRIQEQRKRELYELAKRTPGTTEYKEAQRIKKNEELEESGFQKFVRSLISVKIYDTMSTAKMRRTVDAMLAAGQQPAVINLSRGIDQSDCDSLKQLDTVSILAKGNEFAEAATSFFGRRSVEMSAVEAKCARENLVAVGGLDPSGFVSSYSQESIYGDVLAPSGSGVAAGTTLPKKLGAFNGTSAAAPMVTGSLAAFTQLSGYRLNVQEAKQLLQKTAAPNLSSEFESPRKNGYGTLNAYKIAKVAQRLKEKCSEESTKTFEKCMQQGLEDEKTYQFKPQQVAVEKIFPSCAQPDTNQSFVFNSSCEDRQATFKQLRQQALLNPRRAETWQALSCVYKELGFSENSKLMDSTVAAIKKDRKYVYDVVKKEFERLRYRPAPCNQEVSTDECSGNHARERQNYKLRVTSRSRALRLLSAYEREDLLSWAKVEGIISSESDLSPSLLDMLPIQGLPIEGAPSQKRGG